MLTGFSKRFIYFAFMCMSVLPACISVYHVCALEARGGVRFPGSEITVVSHQVHSGILTQVSARPARVCNCQAIPLAPI